MSTLSFVQFGIMSPEEIRRSSVVSIRKPFTHGGTLEETVYDERMGVLEGGRDCRTCGRGSMECSGHFGSIELVEPVFNPLLLPTVGALLKCICPACGAPRFGKSEAEVSGFLRSNGQNRLRAFSRNYTKVSLCPECGDLLPTFNFQDTSNLQMIYGTKEDGKILTLTAPEVAAIFERISSETMTLLGFNSFLSPNPIFSEGLPSHLHAVSPSSLLFSVLPVLPPCCRPWVISDGEKCHDDLTEQYNTVVRLNEKMRDDRDGTLKTTKRRPDGHLSEVERKKALADLAAHVAAIVDNHKEKGKGTGRAAKGIRERLEGKSGRAQGNVVAKRVDFSARTVIVGGGLDIEAGEIGVPEQIARTLTVQAFVAPWNRDHLSTLVDEGRADTVIRKGRRIVLSVVTKGFTLPFLLEFGDIVERHLVNGDYLIMNRQPSVRIESMQGKRVRIIPIPRRRDGSPILSRACQAFLLPLCVTRAFNADFDGDEMNVHAIQKIAGQAEVATMMGAAHHIVTAQRNGPVSGIVQDGLNWAYLLTEFNPKVSWGVFFDVAIMAGVDGNVLDRSDESFFARASKYYPEIVDKNGHRLSPTIPGKLVISLALPPHFRYSFGKVRIEHGIVLPESGPLDVKSLGPKINSIPHVLYLTAGPTAALSFLTRVQKVTDTWGSSYGFSFGMSDCLVSDRKPVADLISQAEIEVGLLLESGESPEDIERKILLALNNTANRAQVLAAELLEKGKFNALKMMQAAGSKGNVINLMQIGGLVAQQSFAGKRFPRALTSGRRCFLHFRPDDNSAAARGFVANNYVIGLTPTEVFAHAAAGRDGLASTGLGTANSGYLHKKFARKMEDLRVARDGSVRDSSGRIVSFLYGGDGMNARWIAPVTGLPVPYFVDVENLAASYRDRYPSSEARFLSESEVSELIECMTFGGGLFAPTRVLSQALIFARNALCTLLERPGSRVPECAIEEFCQEILDLFTRAQIFEGAMVGLETTSSVGEPTTQMVLNVFHSSGVGAKDVTLGVPRLTELLNATKKPSKPNASIYLNVPDVVEAAASLRKAKGEEVRSAKRHLLETLSDHRYTLEELTLGKLISNIRLERVGDDETTAPLHPGIEIDSYTPGWWTDTARSLFGDPVVEPNDWVVRLTFSRPALFAASKTLEMIAVSIVEAFGPDKASVLFSPLADAEIEIYLAYESIRSTMLAKLSFDEGVELINPSNLPFFTARDVAVPLLRNLVLSGLRGIRSVNLLEDDETKEWYLNASLGKGASFLEILAEPVVDKIRTSINDMWQIAEVLGIEAVRTFLIEEITRIVSFDGTYVNPRHFALLVDAMLSTGDITAVRREGIGRDAGPLAKGTFERALHSLTESAVYGEFDPITGVAACIAVGVPFKGGTGSVRVVPSTTAPRAERKPTVRTTVPTSGMAGLFR